MASRHFSRSCEFHLTRHLLCWPTAGGTTNTSSNSLHMGISHSLWRADSMINSINQSGPGQESAMWHHFPYVQFPYTYPYTPNRVDKCSLIIHASTLSCDTRFLRFYFFPTQVVPRPWLINFFSIFRSGLATHLFRSAYGLPTLAFFSFC